MDAVVLRRLARPDFARRAEASELMDADDLPAALEARAASLLPGLLLARVDGKSPVEYLPPEAERAPVRRSSA